MAYNPIESLAASVHHALLLGLQPLIYHEVEWAEKPDPVTKSRRRETGKTKEVRPYADHCEIVMFQQTWGSTALGFGGIGGSAMTTAYTVVDIGPMGDACVYFAGRLAYHVQRPNQKFREDMAQHSMRDRSGAKAYDTAPEQGGV